MVAVAVGAVTVAAVTGLAMRSPRDPRTGGDAEGALEPLEDKRARIRLPLEGFEPAIAGVPLGATEPRPIVLVVHDAGDQPEPTCERFANITAGHPFVLCPALAAIGMPVEPPPGPVARPDPAPATTRVEAELRGALEALKYRFGRYVAPGSVVLVGIGAGVPAVLEIMQQDPSFFSRVLLVGTDQQQWSSTRAATFATRGGKRVLFACLDPECQKHAARNVLFTERAGAQARYLDPIPGSSRFDARTAEALKKNLPWLTEGDPRFRR